ncbi:MULTISPECIES: rhomboid family intramembrane serine protease [Geobacter]|uniref:rhomboid family intramembrane serine protease n=1 Tax=Geobacter TaxID=28231 RepID=UPI0025742458|nr:rhomboid family intramembrane serine protease [Geobacter sulfurreducens]BEH10823.1 rhomboid family intramembrane serine protease [Geobacter sulfurreducens subsp. ethanolicus]BET58667.1 rhomboid family intramembrane serine protease [Geobacter sp. 60473]HML79682.1 rhomboid family intramembrane serine protease [Geobacter sulfurreducens]
MATAERRSILCPNCRRLINRDEPACPYCGTTRPGSWLKNNPFTRSGGDADRVITIILTVNVIMYVASLLVDNRPPGQGGLFSALSPGRNSLLLLGATGVVPIDRFGRFWTLLSANYLHGGLLHIFFNMMALRQIAPLVAREYGTWRMFSIYTLGGVAGYVASYLAGTGYTIGASCAICALIGSLLYYGKSRGGLYGQAVFKEVWGWVVGLFLFGLIVPGIDNWGHGGGILGGIIMAFILGYRERRSDNLFHTFLAGACALATAVSLLLGFLSVYFTFRG